MLLSTIAVLALIQQPATDDLYSRAYNQCMEASGGVTSNMHDCTAMEIDLQDKKLNAIYQKVLKAQSPGQRKQLIAAQRLWIQYRKANCSFYADPDGGTAAGVASHSCYLRETAERANELGWFLQP